MNDLADRWGQQRARACDEGTERTARPRASRRIDGVAIGLSAWDRSSGGLVEPRRQAG